MKYAIVNGERRGAVRGLKGTCEVCEVLVRPRCGRFRAPHWAHPPGIVDHHWEPETDWHRRWKALFPEECQEITHRADNGERHRADVKTAHGHVLEFQHSAIPEQERSLREAIYRPMFWVVNGMRLGGDRRAFIEELRLRRVVRAAPLTFVVPTGKCLLLRKWEKSQAFVFLDFGEVAEESDPVRFSAPVLWGLRPGSPKGIAALIPVDRKQFVEAMIKGEAVRGFVSKAAAPVAPRPRLVVSLPAQPWIPRSQKRKRFGTPKRRSWGRRPAPRGGWRM